MIHLHGVRVVRSGRLILEVDNLSVGPNEFVGIVGPNGAGKSTLLSLAGGQVHPDYGEVRVRGRNPSTISRKERFHLLSRIGWVRQLDDYSPDLPISVFDVVLLGRAGIRGFGRRFTREDRSTAARWIHDMGIPEYRDALFRNLSGGEKRKVILARAFAQQPDVLLFDEPMAALDLEWRERLIQLLGKVISESKVTTLMVTHDTSELPSSCGRIVLLSGGRIIADGPKRDVLVPSLLSRVYGCEVEVREREGRYHTIGVAPTVTEVR